MVSNLMKKFLQITGAVFIGSTASLMTVSGLTAAHHNYWAYQWSKTCDFKPYALLHAEKAAALNPIYGQTVVDIGVLSPCNAQEGN